MRTIRGEGRRDCPACGAQSLVLLAPGRVCAECESARAWDRIGAPGRKLVLSREELDRADPEREARQSRARRIRGAVVLALPTVIVAAAAACAAAGFARLFSARPVAALSVLVERLENDARFVVIPSFVAFTGGIVMLLRLARTRYFRSWRLLLPNLAALAAGAVFLAVGLLHWISASHAGGWKYRTVPPISGVQDPSAGTALRSTVVILAPDADGNARYVSLGTGAIVAARESRTYVVTCRHVSMPYVSPAARVRAEDAQAVWLEFSDGREARGRVSWVAEPPLDVALVEADVRWAGPVVPLAPDTASIVPPLDVFFVPNPLRGGWMVHRGLVVARDLHDTPAGRFSLVCTSLPVEHGDSGSGLYDAEGRLIGLNTWKQEGGVHRGISLPSETMSSVLEFVTRPNGAADAGTPAGRRR